MKITKYVGRIYDGARGMYDIDRKIFAVYEDGHEEEIPERQDLVNHSPTGFCWGYSGSGPAQAALALTAHYFANVYGDSFKGDRIALSLYQVFKSSIISRLPMDQDFEIPTDLNFF